MAEPTDRYPDVMAEAMDEIESIGEHPTAPGPMSDERLAEIRERDENARLYKPAYYEPDVSDLLAEVERLRAELNTAKVNVQRVLVRAQKAEAERDHRAEQVKRVRDLHKAVILGGTCTTCGHHAPCPTVRALDDEEADRA